ncbi:hypothetical protein [Thiopseudomonas denitrificans]|uniref:hypothetical protein n=1 Tax=Thiopseudomonas denitrificans TaxID=1501432 RepID=UPI00105E2BFA|nr:hypothetical protein [Thiopseudomonas denitrificans]
MSTKDLNDLSYTDAAIATVVGGLSQGKGLAGTAGISMGGAYVGSQIKGEDATAPVIGAGVGAAAGYVGGKHIENKVKNTLPGKSSEISGVVAGESISGTVSDTVEKVTQKIREQKDASK